MLAALSVVALLAQPSPGLAARYRATATRIIDAAMTDDGAWKKLAHLCDRIGARPSGSPAMARAVGWAKGAFEADGHENVHSEEVKVPTWVRGFEEATMVRPTAQPLWILGLGGTVGTPRNGLEADVIAVPSFEALDALGEKVKGKIVLFSRRLEAVEDGQLQAYGSAVAYRGGGPSRAARLGAVGAFIRSLATRSLRSPHTGGLRYDPTAPKIPAAALSTEDADLIVRLLEAGERVTVRLKLSGKMGPEAQDANVLAELRGREHPEEVVLLGAHLDSWDVGQGAHDDGVGVAMVMHAITVLRKLGLTPRRTIRVVLFANEETAGRGAEAYAQKHHDELINHVAALESDTGGGRPLGLSLPPKAAGIESLRELTSLLSAIAATRARSDGATGADLRPLVAAGVPAIAFDNDVTHYFDYHHSQADTLDKVDATDLRKNVAALAVTSYILADMPGRLGR
jgi:carboxypeptidase Q